MSKPHGTKEFWLAALRAEGELFQAALTRDGAFDQAVPSCPGWTVVDLVRHLGSEYGWVRSHVARGVRSAPETEFDAQAPSDGPGLARWWTGERDALLGLLDEVDPELPAWNWAPQAKKALFWHRRMAHETAIHRWDAQMATGLAEPIEAKLAADGLTEVLDTWLPAGRRHDPAPRHGMIALDATDLDEVWYVRLRGEGMALLDTDTLLDDDDHHERATAMGTASDLLLAVYGRIPFDVLELGGDVGLLDGLRTG